MSDTSSCPADSPNYPEIRTPESRVPWKFLRWIEMKVKCMQAGVYSWHDRDMCLCSGNSTVNARKCSLGERIMLARWRKWNPWTGWIREDRAFMNGDLCRPEEKAADRCFPCARRKASVFPNRFDSRRPVSAFCEYGKLPRSRVKCNTCWRSSTGGEIQMLCRSSRGRNKRFLLLLLNRSMSLAEFKSLFLSPGNPKGMSSLPEITFMISMRIITVAENRTPLKSLAYLKLAINIRMTYFSRLKWGRRWYAV